jgi:DNA-binding SARP family transcriptional activator
MVDLPRQLAAQQLQAMDGTARIVVIHPNYAKQHLVLQTLLEHKSAVYVRFVGVNLSRQQLREQLEQALPSEKGQSSLGNVGWLVLDECDRANPDAFSTFLPELQAASSSIHIAVITRTVPECILTLAELRSSTHFLPNEPSLMLWDYAQRPNPPALLEVRSFGAGHVLLNGQNVDSWDGVLPRSLFFFLVDQGMTTRNQIFETFWPHLSTREATNVFHVTKRKISEVLGTDLTAYVSGFYRISPNIELSYDAALFTETIQSSAVLSSEEAVDLLRRAIALYKGPFLTSLPLEWVKSRRGELLQMYGEALVALAKTCEDAGDIHESLGLYLRAILTNRQREDLAANAMRLYHGLRMHNDALVIYERLCEELETKLHMQPAPFIQELAAAIRSDLG